MGAQISVERMLLLTAILILISIIFFWFYMSSIESRRRISVEMVRDALKEIVDLAEEMREWQYPVIKVLELELPEGIVEAKVSDRVLTYSIKVGDAWINVDKTSEVRLRGSLPISSGKNLVTLRLLEDKSVEIIPGPPLPVIIFPYSYRISVRRGEVKVINFTIRNVYSDEDELRLELVGEIAPYGCINERLILTEQEDGIFTNVPQHFGKLFYARNELDGKLYYFILLDSNGDSNYDSLVVDEDTDLENSLILNEGQEFLIINKYKIASIEKGGNSFKLCLSTIRLQKGSELNFSVHFIFPISMESGILFGKLEVRSTNYVTSAPITFVVRRPNLSLSLATFADEACSQPSNIFNPLDRVFFEIQLRDGDELLPGVLKVNLVNLSGIVETKTLITYTGKICDYFQLPFVSEDSIWSISAVDAGTSFVNSTSFFLDALNDDIVITTYKDEDYTLVCDLFKLGETVFYEIEIKNRDGIYLSRIVNFTIIDPNLNIQPGSFQNKLIHTPYRDNFSIPLDAATGQWNLSLTYKIRSYNKSLTVGVISAPGSIYWDTLLYPFTVRRGGKYFYSAVNCPRDAELIAQIKVLDQDGRGVEGVFQTGSTDACIEIRDEDLNILEKCGIAEDLGGGYYRYIFQCSRGIAGKTYVMHVIITQHAIPGAGISIVKVKNSRTFNVI
ncbi:MAG: hypothetical protein QW507_00875 [Candidatus Nanoarchaeia archaeon]|nr:hypothetical protein [Candidatus Haiyanarchaeum thermophilum]MCW1303944.1 hypothetical protein [Candidatus Haiyanarchaeum thermophilum]MCW1307568.1 hypothetical protein [Candidatus Haiyanarchaeum thermophilum]MCW1308192.1 hypothetical protein [Candidatus Haiyanarchaeum thermophilum]MCW1308550.1 hypothetical protein [Candidatus Haiyanarchaeum thermophilum]